uniref:Uncharacterized protein n=1 Tax=Lepeophtheirus salmonis TaxID=72036 RepID=A0A0K2UL26_LEPSM
MLRRSIYYLLSIRVFFSVTIIRRHKQRSKLNRDEVQRCIRIIFIRHLIEQ